MAQPGPPFDWRTLAADLFAYHEQVLDRLARQKPSVDPDLLYDAFVQTILQISREPERFDSTRGSLPAFLRGAPRRAALAELHADPSLAADPARWHERLKERIGLPESWARPYARRLAQEARQQRTFSQILGL